MSTNFQNLFKTDSSFQSHLDALLEHDENAPLLAQTPGAGNYGNPQYTVGFGFDIRGQTGQEIINDFTAAGISLVVNGVNTTNDLKNYTSWKYVYSKHYRC